VDSFSAYQLAGPAFPAHRTITWATRKRTISVYTNNIAQLSQQSKTLSMAMTSSATHIAVDAGSTVVQHSDVKKKPPN
jgi:hypothetical protein